MAKFVSPHSILRLTGTVGTDVVKMTLLWVFQRFHTSIFAAEIIKANFG
jgi:hypothetical protein